MSFVGNKFFKITIILNSSLYLITLFLMCVKGGVPCGRSCSFLNLKIYPSMQLTTREREATHFYSWRHCGFQLSQKLSSLSLSSSFVRENTRDTDWVPSVSLGHMRLIYTNPKPWCVPSKRCAWIFGWCCHLLVQNMLPLHAQLLNILKKKISLK